MASHLPGDTAGTVRHGELMPGVRPVTLLIASGIILITAILIVTGLAAGHLRDAALVTTESELARIDTVLAEAANRSFRAADIELGEIADQLHGHDVPAGSAAAPALSRLLQDATGRFEQIAAIALIGADGKLIDSAGAWPTELADITERDFVAALRSGQGAASAIGLPVKDAKTGEFCIPVARRIEDAAGALVGIAVALVPVSDFVAFYQTVRLGDDAKIALLRRDGIILAQYPQQPGMIGQAGTGGDLDPLFGPGSASTVRQTGSPDGEWRIEAVHALADYPVAVAVSRIGNKALAGWAHQALLFGMFALIVAVAIGVMVYLIARQFHVHAALAVVRAEKIEIERARLAAEAELLKAERLSVLGQLTATVAHELRNPLSAIRNTLFTVKELAVSGGLKLDRPVARMERSIERCDRIISDLLEYTRTRDLRRSSHIFDRWLADIVAEQSASPSIALTTQFGAGEIAVQIDGDRMRRVVVNLVENAVQALAEMPADREKRITVITGTADDALTLAVEDTGPGIPPENRTRIFEPLFSTKSFGTGLGLPTVKQIVNQHGGKISIDSEVGRGTRVTVCLPLEAPAIEEIKVAA
jgi:signal transduction histidine kinase